MIQIFYNDRKLTRPQALAAAKAILKRVNKSILNDAKVAYRPLDDVNLEAYVSHKAANFAGKDVVVLAYNTLYV